MAGLQDEGGGGSKIQQTFANMRSQVNLNGWPVKLKSSKMLCLQNLKCQQSRWGAVRDFLQANNQIPLFENEPAPNKHSYIITTLTHNVDQKILFKMV